MSSRAEASIGRHEEAQRWILTGKDLLALLRDLVLVMLFLFLLVVPGFIGDRLAQAGFEEGSMMGFTWKRKARDYGKEAIQLKQALEAANQRLQQQAVQLRRTEQQLLSLRSGATDPAQKDRVDTMLAGNRALQSQTIEASRSLANRLRSSQPIVQEAGEFVGSAPGWAVVMGADRSIDAAEYEARLAIQRGMTNIGLFRRQGYFRTVALASTKQAAQAMIPRARQRSSDAYVVTLDKWCPQREVRDGYTDCLGS